MPSYERQEKSQRRHIPFNSGASRAIPPPPVQKPGWKGPSYVKKVTKTPKPTTPATTSSSTEQAQLLPVELQQLLLNIFRTTFPVCQDPEALKPVLQEIKDALFRRDFASAFGTEAWCEAYAVRWSPSRVLGYVNVLAWIVEECAEEEWVKSFAGCEKRRLRVVCIGGGAAEVVAFNALVRHIKPETRGIPSNESQDVKSSLDSLTIHEKDNVPVLDMHLVDTASWDSVVSKLNRAMVTPPILSKYASASARAANASFLRPQATEVVFTQADILSLEKAQLRSLVEEGPLMITMFFTLNELYSTDLAKTTKLLLDLSLNCQKNTLLCVIDSAGSYSEILVRRDGKEVTERDSPSVAPTQSHGDDTEETSSSKPSKRVSFAEENGEAPRKKYPMHYLMDHVLLGKGRKAEGVKPLWEKVIVDESRWFRLDDSLRYPISLENMRFQVHLFKRV